MRKLSELGSLEGRVAVVTGGAGHLGRAFAEALSESKAHVVLVDRDEASCDKQAVAIRAHAGGEVFALATDLADPASAQRIVERTVARFGRLDVLVNNAAFTGASGLTGWAVPFHEQKLEAWDAALRVNLSAPFLLTQAAQPVLEAGGCGSVINVASIYALVGPDNRLYDGTTMGNPAAYGASKAGLLQLTRHMATSMAPRIRVNAITPGGIERGQPATFQERYVFRTPLGRMGREEDFKGVVAFLASDLSAWVTGQNFVVDGGWTAW